MWFRSIVIAIALVAVLAVAAVTLGDTERTGDFKDDVLQHVPLGDQGDERENESDEQDGEEREQAGDDDSKADERENENEQESDQKDAAGPLAAVSSVTGDGGDGGDDEDEPIDCSIPDNADDSGCDTEDADNGDSDDSTSPSTTAPGDSDVAIPLGGVDTGAGGTPRLLDADNGILGEINRVRARFGLRLLHRSARLERAATARSRDMALRGYFSHTIPGAGLFWKRVLPSYKPSGFRWWLLGENLFWSAPLRPARFVVRAWLNSPPHRRVLLHPSWNDAGIGALRTTSGAPGVYGHQPVTIVTAEFGMFAR